MIDSNSKTHKSPGIKQGSWEVDSLLCRKKLNNLLKTSLSKTSLNFEIRPISKTYR